MIVTYPSGDVKWAIASITLALKKDARDFDVFGSHHNSSSIQSHGTKKLSWETRQIELREYQGLNLMAMHSIKV